MPRILIADDHPIVRRYVRAALEEKGWEVCGEAATGREAIAKTAVQKPDIVVLDISMPELNGLEAVREIHKNFPEIEMLILTMYDARELVLEALAAGARDCLLKSDLKQLVAAVQNVLQQSQHCSHPASDSVL